MEESERSNYFKLYTNFLDHLPIPVVLLNKQQRIQHINQAFSALSQYKIVELLHQPADSLFPLNSYFLTPRTWSKSAHPAKLGRIKSEQWLTSVIKKNGIPVDVRVLISHYDFKQKGFRMVVLIPVREQSRHWHYEQKLNQSIPPVTLPTDSAALSMSSLLKEELTKIDLCRVFNTAGIMLFSLNKIGCVQSMNPEARRLLKYDERDFQANLHIKDLIVPDDKPDQVDSALYIQETSYIMEFLFQVAQQKHHRYHEVKLRDKHHDTKMVLLSVSLFENKSQQIQEYLCVALDITERKRQEELLMASLEKEKKLSDIKSMFVSIASHEFRTPLSTILSSAHLASKYQSAEDQYKRDRHLNRIISAVNTLNDILNDFLNAGKIEEGKIFVKMCQQDVPELFNQTLHDIKANARKGQVFTYRHEGKEKFMTDVSLVRNMLINLLSNAIKFSPENASIDIHSQVKDSILYFKIKDEGIGIEPQDMKHLTERFYRGANAIHIQGTGLGMHIVAKYVERLGGTMKCESQQGKGTVFSIELPEGGKE